MELELGVEVLKIESSFSKRNKLHHLAPSVADPGKLASNHMRVVQLFESVNNL